MCCVTYNEALRAANEKEEIHNKKKQNIFVCHFCVGS